MKDNLIIFDLDGTLLDTIGDLGNAANEALRLRNLPLHGKEEYPALVGNGIRNLVKRSLPEQFRDDDAYIESALADFKQYYFEHIHDETLPYPGIPELLHDLQKQGEKMAVASNKFNEGTIALIGYFFPHIRFTTVTGNNPGMPLKPSPEIIQYIVKKTFNGSEGHRNVILVGDSEVDVNTALAAGIPSIGVTWGFRRRESLEGATLIADNIEELRAHIKQLTDNNQTI